MKIFYVEKKKNFDVEAKKLLEDFRSNLNIKGLENVRLLNKYIFDGENLKGIENIIFEPSVDNLYINNFEIYENEKVFAVEYLPGQYDQRADAASECLAILNNGKKINAKNTKIIILKGNLSQEDILKIKKYYINFVDSKEVNPFENEFSLEFNKPKKVEVLNGFTDFDINELEKFHKKNDLAMSIKDLEMVKNYFLSEQRNPTITEIKVIDTYWSDHCRHTTFLTNITDIEVAEGKYQDVIKSSIKKYYEAREFVYEDLDKPVTLMDIAVIAMKEMRKRGVLDDLDLSEEINACSINVSVDTDKGKKDYLLMFKNETHNHPTEIEPFGGAATCLGGAIRDPLSGRAYVYQAMRITGSADPTVSIDKTIEGKLPQRTITIGAAHGYSSYGNQIGLATGEVREVYHDGYAAKRMEVGAVIAATPKENVIRDIPRSGDVVILLGGKTGRDGCGGATGSSKEHDKDSIDICGAQVQKGNAPVERKIQRLFRNGELTRLIKRCNDFGAGGVAVAIGELSESLDINLDLIPKKYEGLDGTELAISESQERMAVVVNEFNATKFLELAQLENLEATVVAKITDTGYMRMFWRDEKIVDLKREFLNTNGATQYAKVKVENPSENSYFDLNKNCDIEKKCYELSEGLNLCSQKGLIERFDSTIGARSILMPLGGKYQLTRAEAMAAKIPVLDANSKECSIMAAGINAELSLWSPFHGAYYSVIESITRTVAAGGDYRKIRLSFQEYFEKLGNDSVRWGKPFAGLLGAFKAQMDLDIPAIGGKDSMSGSFLDLDVPPTLISFAVSTVKNEEIKSPEFKQLNSKIIYIKTEKTKDDLLDIAKLKVNLDKIVSLNKKNQILSISSIKANGIFEAIFNMSIGNKIGCKLDKNLTLVDLFGANYGSFVIEVNSDFDIDKLKNIDFKIIGETKKEKELEINDVKISIEKLIELSEGKLSAVFPIKTEDSKEYIENIEYISTKKMHASYSVEKPQVLIPVFPGTNCEYDSRDAFEKAGAVVKELIFKNLNEKLLNQSINDLEDEIKKSQIIMLPGGFSAGDEPDGSAKFIATVFRNPKIKNAVTDLLENREGLILGICNGFQALIKLGLVPYGKILDANQQMPTLTYNKIGRHMSSIIKTKICSNKSPWLANVSVGDIHSIPVSHGEGRFVASNEIIQSLIKNGQISTQYVDLNGNATSDMPFNPNGSMMAVEGITSYDGRVLGKMGHSERVGENLYKNIYGDFDQKIFEAGVNYFK